MARNPFSRRLSGSMRPLGIFLTVICVIVGICGIFMLRSRPLPGGTLEIRFLDVGQGDSTLIRTEEGCILLDTGDPSARQDVYFALNSFGNRLEYLIISHAHADHMGGAAYILEKMDVGTVILPRTVSSDDAYVQLLDAVSESGASVLFADAGLTFSLGGADFRILAPLNTYEDENNRSALIRMDFGRVSALFTGDAESVSEADQIDKYSIFRGSYLDADILKVPHHGSSSSSTVKYLRAVSPKFAVISCGRDNAYGHPSSDVLKRLENIGAQIYRTDRDGTVSLITDGETIRAGG